MRDLPSIDAQRLAVSRWLVKFGGRRHSEAAMEVTSMSAPARRQWFRRLRQLHCIEWQDADSTHPAGWYAVADLPADSPEYHEEN